MKWNWLKRWGVRVKAKLGWTKRDSQNQKYIHQHGKAGRHLLDEEKYAAGIKTVWWNFVLDSRERTFRCISGVMDFESVSSAKERVKQSIILDRRCGSVIQHDRDPKHKEYDDEISISLSAACAPPSALKETGVEAEKSKQSNLEQTEDTFSFEIANVPDPDEAYKSCETETGYSPPLAAYAPPSAPEKSGSRKGRTEIHFSCNSSIEEDAPLLFFRHEQREEQREKPFTEKEYFQILEEQSEKCDKYVSTRRDRPLLPPHFVSAVDMLMSQMELSRNEFSDRSLLDVKIYDRIKRKEDWQPKADTCKAILFALRPNVITALQLYHLAGYTFRECDEDLLLLCMFGIGDYDIETYNRVMASRGLRQLGSKSKK